MNCPFLAMSGVVAPAVLQPGDAGGPQDTETCCEHETTGYKRDRKFTVSSPGTLPFLFFCIFKCHLCALSVECWLFLAFYCQVALGFCLHVRLLCFTLLIISSKSKPKNKSQ